MGKARTLAGTASAATASGAAAALAIGFFLGREHAQAEERYIKANGKVRANTKWPEFGTLQPKLWNTDSVLDFVVPAVCVVLIAAHSDAVIGALQTLVF